MPNPFAAMYACWSRILPPCLPSRVVLSSAVCLKQLFTYSWMALRSNGRVMLVASDVASREKRKKTRARKMPTSIISVSCAFLFLADNPINLLVARFQDGHPVPAVVLHDNVGRDVQPREAAIAVVAGWQGLGDR